jgi:hypothetical protein
LQEFRPMRTSGVTLVVLGLLAALGRGDLPAPNRKPKFTLGKETTYVTGPLDKEGYIDYAAALNKRMSAGIKPDDNANVLLWKALGPHPDGAKVAPEYFKWLGIPAPPERGDYWISQERFAREHPKLVPSGGLDFYQGSLFRASQRPWTPKNHPGVAAWLKGNEKPLALAVEATRRPHYFNPLIPELSKNGSDGLVSARLPSVQGCRELAFALAARAMLHAGQGKPDDAWHDLLACHRLARLVAQGGTLIEGLVGVATDAVASRADLAFLAGSRLTAKQIRACLSDLEKLTRFPLVADKIDAGERFLMLDNMQQIGRQGAGFMKRMGGASGQSLGAPVPGMEAALKNLDWDPALRLANRWYDRLSAALRLKDRVTREKASSNLYKEVLALQDSIPKAVAVLHDPPAKDAAKAKGRAVGTILVSLLLPRWDKVQQAADRAEQTQANLRLAFALALYRAENGRYPAKLAALAPKYLAAVPSDLFSGKPLIYRPSEKGYLLYSVGPNGKDDGGQGYADDPPGDDLAVRMPLPGEPRRK